MKRTLSFIAAVVIAGSAGAAEYRMDFTATAFADLAGSSVAPYGAVSGSVRWIADTPTGPMLALTGIDLAIGTSVYSLGEITFLNGLGVTSVIGGALSGANGMAAGTKDFSLGFERTGQFGNFFYTLPGATANWFTEAPHGSVSISAVPEGATGGLMACGLAWLAAVAGRRGKVAGA